MQKKRSTKLLSLLLCLVLIAAVALCMGGCGGNKPTTASGTGSNESSSAGTTVLGEGKTTFPFTVIDANGKASAYEIHTDKATVGDALLALGLIAGEDSAYGLYVKTVNGVTVDYDKDGKYWAFYVNGEYAALGVDATEIQEGAAYSFKVE